MTRIARDRTVPVAFVGAGPGGSGPLVCAAQQGRLGELLDRGALVLDRAPSFASAGTIGRYALNADSHGTSFLECLDNEQARRELSVDELPAETLALERYRHGHPALSLVGAHLARVGEALGRALERHPNSAFVPRTTLRRLTMLSGGEVGLETVGPGAGECRRYRCRSAVLALGGRQDLATVLAERIGRGPRLNELDDASIVLTEALLTPRGLAEAGRCLRGISAPRVLVIGSSHSAFSAAWALLRIDRVSWRPGSIRILQREAPRVFYPTRAAAHADGYRVAGDDVCPRTQRVHRLGGLRGDGRELWRAITGRPGAPAEDRVELISLQDALDASALWKDADLIVPAFGYRARTVPVVDELGARLRLAAEVGEPLVDGDCRLRLAGGGSLPRLFGIGMACGFRPSGPMGGEPSFRGQTNGVWLYQNGIGARVLAGIGAVLAEAA